MLRRVPAVSVATCEMSHSHMFYFDLVLEDRSHLLLNSQDLPGRRQCLDSGTVLEKNRWHLGWTLNGAYVKPDSTSMAAWGIIATVCFIVAVGAGLLGLHGSEGE